MSPSPVSPGRNPSKSVAVEPREPEKGLYGAVRDLAKVEVPTVRYSSKLRTFLRKFVALF